MNKRLNIMRMKQEEK